MSQTTQFKGMKCRLVGRSGLWVSEVGLGLWKWGDPSYDGSRVGDHNGFAILDRALELGVFHWDTACSYNRGSGNSERLLGRYFYSRGRAVREKVVLATKIKNPVRPEHVMEKDATPNQGGASRVYIRNAVDNCLQRLQTDYIDLVYLHSPVVDDEGNFVVPLEETWGAMDDLITQGKVCYIAVSNHSAAQMNAVQQCLEEVGKDASRRIVAVQNRYSMLERTAVTGEEDGSEPEFLAACDQMKIGLVPFYPLASGALTGRYRRNNLDQATGRIIDDGAQDTFLTERNLNVIEGLIPLAEKKGITLAQLAIAWLLAKSPVCSVIAGVTRMEHLDDNAQASQTQLSEKDMAMIGEVLAQAGE